MPDLKKLAEPLFEHLRKDTHEHHAGEGGGKDQGVRALAGPSTHTGKTFDEITTPGKQGAEAASARAYAASNEAKGSRNPDSHGTSAS